MFLTDDQLAYAARDVVHLYDLASMSIKEQIDAAAPLSSIVAEEDAEGRKEK